MSFNIHVKINHITTYNSSLKQRVGEKNIFINLIKITNHRDNLYLYNQSLLPQSMNAVTEV